MFSIFYLKTTCNVFDINNISIILNLSKETLVRFNNLIKDTCIFFVIIYIVKLIFSACYLLCNSLFLIAFEVLKTFLNCYKDNFVNFLISSF